MIAGRHLSAGLMTTTPRLRVAEASVEEAVVGGVGADIIAAHRQEAGL